MGILSITILVTLVLTISVIAGPLINWAILIQLVAPNLYDGFLLVILIKFYFLLIKCQKLYNTDSGQTFQDVRINPTGLFKIKFFKN